ncbi:cell wall-binding repeat-containing protein [Catenulispora rubra]|uniref:cell wall-binding repeat-containing protein n=1 Tax=Catenulispora rubra TaxID=280293 RepID=UPI0018924A9B|nr:cell wall-binding repeat-containing protein [Catenulispora rubra]
MFRTAGAAFLGAVTAVVATGVFVAPAHATAQGDNGFIVFQTPVDNHFHIALAHADGSGYHVLNVNGPGMALPPILVQPAMSPDGSRIAFAESGGSNAVWTAHADGTHVVRITAPPPSGSDSQPAWSPDGTKVYFTRVASAPASSQIFSAYADGSGGTASLSGAPTGFLDSAPDAAANGDVAFARSDGPSPGVYVRSANGTTNLFAANGNHPSYSPSGTLLAYDAPVVFAGVGIYYKPTNGGSETFLNGTGFGSHPSWSPDGFKIAYQVSPANAGIHLQTVDVNSDTVTGVKTGVPVGQSESAPSWQPMRNATVDRVGGNDRIDTAVATSRLGYDAAGSGGRQAGGAVLTRSDSFADALAGSALAAKTHSPLLLTGTGALDPRVAAELKRVLTPGSQVTLLGGEDVLSANTANQVRALGFSTRRLAGPDRYATATAIADAITQSPTRILVATGNNFPDALAAGAATGTSAIAGKSTVVLLSNDRVLPPATAAYLAAHVTSNTELYGIGDQGVAALRTAFSASRVGAVAGPDRYATAAAVARTFFTGPTTPHTIGLAVGGNWPDALAGGALLGAHTGPLLLAAGPSLPGVEGDYTAPTAPAVDEVLVFGGTDVVPDAAAFAVSDLVSVPGHRSYFINRTAPLLP